MAPAYSFCLFFVIYAIKSLFKNVFVQFNWTQDGLSLKIAWDKLDLGRVKECDKIRHMLSSNSSNFLEEVQFIKSAFYKSFRSVVDVPAELNVCLVLRSLYLHVLFVCISVCRSVSLEDFLSKHGCINICPTGRECELEINSFFRSIAHPSTNKVLTTAWLTLSELCNQLSWSAWQILRVLVI